MDHEDRTDEYPKNLLIKMSCTVIITFLIINTFQTSKDAEPSNLIKQVPEVIYFN